LIGKRADGRFQHEWRSDAAAAQRLEQRWPWRCDARRKDRGALMGAQQRQMLDERWQCPGQRWTATQAVARPDGGTLAHRHRRGNGVARWSSGTRSRLLEWWRKEEGPGRRGARRRRGGGPAQRPAATADRQRPKAGVPAQNRGGGCRREGPMAQCRPAWSNGVQSISKSI
jgi:hypothetical protein